MGKPCSICALGPERRADVEKMARDEGHRKAGRVFGLSYQAIGRHLAPEHLIRVELATPEEAPAAPPAPPANPSRKPALPYKARYPRVAALQTPDERKGYITELLRRGRFHGFRTVGHLSLLWDDLGPLEFSDLVSRAADDLNVRRGSETARRIVIARKCELIYAKAMAAGDLRTAARILATWVAVETPIDSALHAATSSQAFAVIAQALQQYPEALSAVHAALAAEDARKRAACAPPGMEPRPDVARAA